MVPPSLTATGTATAISSPNPDARTLHLGCDPQTSGGLLISIAPSDKDALIALMKSYGVAEDCQQPIGEIKEKKGEKWVELMG